MEAGSKVYKGQGSDPYHYIVSPSGAVFAMLQDPSGAVRLLKAGDTPKPGYDKSPKQAILDQIRDGIATEVPAVAPPGDAAGGATPDEVPGDAADGETPDEVPGDASGRKKPDLPRAVPGGRPPGVEDYQGLKAKATPKEIAKPKGETAGKPEQPYTRDPVVRAARAFFAFAPTAAAAANQARLGVQGATRGAVSAMIPESTKEGFARAGEHFGASVDEAYNRALERKR